MVNKKYSFQDFTHKTFFDVKPEAFRGVIKGSCFSRETFGKVFPDGAEITFERCNLDNCDLSNITANINGGCKQRYGVQNDKEDWVVKDGEPYEPVNKKRFERLGIPTDPKYIPERMRTGNSITAEVRKQLEAIDG